MLPHFVLDVHLGKLARHLRMIGLDATWNETGPLSTDDELRRIASAEGRILLTRDRELHERMDPLLRLYVDATDPTEQFVEILARFELFEHARAGKGFLSRCLQCNSPILPAKPHHVTERVPGHLLLEHDEFYLCPRCERVYWKGSHFDRMKKWVADLVATRSMS